MRFEFRIIGGPMGGATTVGEGGSRYRSQGSLGFLDSISYVPLIIGFRFVLPLIGRWNSTQEGSDRPLGGWHRGRARLECNPSNPRKDENGENNGRHKENHATATKRVAEPTTVRNPFVGRIGPRGEGSHFMSMAT